MQASDTPNVDTEKLAKLQRMAAGVRTGGKGSVRRKKKAVHKAAPTDDKRLQSTLKRLQLNQLPGIEEVNIIRDNGSVIQFKNPKVQAQVPANTYVVSGPSQTKEISSLMSNVMNSPPSASPAELAKIQAYMEQLRSSGALPDSAVQGLNDLAAEAAGGAPHDHSAHGHDASHGAADHEEEDDDDVPDLVDNQNFDAAAKPAAHDKPNGGANGSSAD